MGEINAIGPPLSSPGQVSCAGPALRRNGNIYIMIGRARGRAGPRLKMARTLSSSSAGAGLAGGCGLAGAWTRPELQVPGHRRLGWCRMAGTSFVSSQPSAEW